MLVSKILYTDKFLRLFKKLPDTIKNASHNKVEIFKINPLHPSLRLHELKGKFSGLWSITINNNYRLIFERKGNGDIVFISIGKHDIYRNP
jgi:addiction module RelE/StbE family toxin